MEEKFLNLDLENLSFAKIKEEFSNLNINLKSEKAIQVSNKLLDDKRKNVKSLGEKILKEKKKLEDEIIRVKSMYDFDKERSCKKILAGVDEVGRGPLAGPIVVASVVLNLDVLDDDLILYLNDSKKLSESKREELANIIKEKAISYSIKEATNEEIDNRGIAVCNNALFIEATHSLSVKPEIVLSDGYPIRGIDIKNEFVIKGDAKSATIAAASIIAKVYRDNLMKEYDKEYPEYGFYKNVGYGASKHIEAIKKFGPTKIHRMSFLSNILRE